MFVIVNLRRYRVFIVIIITVLIVATLIMLPPFLLKNMYPLKYKDIVEKYSMEYNIDFYLVMAIIKVESNFDKNAVSHKGAKGLMQLTGQTAQWGAQALNLSDYTSDKVYDPETNIKIGCWYINRLMQEFDNDLTLVLAAYNGGSGNVNKWLQDKNLSSSGKTLDKIPFKETENYVKKVIREYHVYKKLYQNKTTGGQVK